MRGRAARARTIAVVTGSRAEFGLLRPVMRAIDAHPALRLRVIVAGLHLSAGTWRDVTAAGFAIDRRVRMQHRRHTGRRADAEAVARGVAGFSRAFEEIGPDLVLVLGDRIEPFAAASAASIGGRRLAHIHGGDRAEGIADEAMRHAISKLAHLHFTATAQSRRRLIRMGEPPERIHNVGSPAVDMLAPGKAPGSVPGSTTRARRPCHRQTAIAPGRIPDGPELILLQHPIGADVEQEHRWMRQTLAATRGHRRLAIAPNHDAGCEGILGALGAARIDMAEHLPRPRFLALLAGARALVGNSSAGLIEAAALRIPAVNIGPRQAGREKPANVIDCDYGAASVAAAVRKALRLDLSRMRHPYGDGRAGLRIARILADLPLRDIPLAKRNAY